MQVKKSNHVSEVIFIVTLFSIFLISGVLLVLFGANIYQKITSESSVNKTIRTSLSYITEKVHQNDHKDCIYVDNLNGTNALVLKTTYESTDYVTYIYYDNGALKELFTKSDMEFDPSIGDSITDIKSLIITEKDSLIHLIITDTQNQSHELYIHTNSD